MNKKNDSSKILLEQILSITKQNSEKIDKVNILVEKTRTNVENQNEILKSHSQNIEKNNDRLGDYNTQLEIHIQRSEMLEQEMKQIKKECAIYDNHIVEHNHSRYITYRMLKYTGIIIGAIGSIIGILKYFGKI